MALFAKRGLKAIILIERKSDKELFNPLATGFLVGFLLNKDPDPLKSTYRIFLVTNRHVFEGLDELWIRFDKKESAGTARFPLRLSENGENKWLAHKDQEVDLAMVTINANFLNENGIDWTFFNEERFAYPEQFSKIGIELGDEIFLAGFPMGISGDIQNYAIVRKGSIARVDSEIIKVNKSFLIDAFVFPGNSGGPVLLKPEISSLENTKAVNSVYVLGVVSGYKVYKEPLFSHQSNPPEIAAISIENSGLASVVPMNFTKDIYQDFIEKQKKLEEEIKGKNEIIQEKIEASQK